MIKSKNDGFCTNDFLYFNAFQIFATMTAGYLNTSKQEGWREGVGCLVELVQNGLG